MFHNDSDRASTRFKDSSSAVITPAGTDDVVEIQNATPPSRDHWICEAAAQALLLSLPVTLLYRRTGFIVPERGFCRRECIHIPDTGGCSSSAEIDRSACVKAIAVPVRTRQESS